MRSMTDSNTKEQAEEIAEAITDVLEGEKLPAAGDSP